MEWTDEYVQIVCSLMAEQVGQGNRPNTHLNPLGYNTVSERFYQMTGISLSKTQLKNKWDKLKGDWSCWNKLMRKQTGTGWDSSKGVIVMDNEWWKKARKVSVVIYYIIMVIVVHIHVMLMIFLFFRTFLDVASLEKSLFKIWSIFPKCLVIF